MAMGKALFLIWVLFFPAVMVMAQHWDSDGDGIADSTDGCPYVAGPAQYNGCPGIPVDLPAPAPVYFAIGQSGLDEAARRHLDRLSRIALADTTIYVYLYGHTDNTGNAAVNMALSLRRAAQCRQYLIDKGLSAYRVMAKGMGEEAPPADNNTAAGRRQNRCVVPGLKKMKK